MTACPSINGRYACSLELGHEPLQDAPLHLEHADLHAGVFWSYPKPKPEPVAVDPDDLRLVLGSVRVGVNRATREAQSRLLVALQP